MYKDIQLKANMWECQQLNCCRKMLFAVSSEHLWKLSLYCYRCENTILSSNCRKGYEASFYESFSCCREEQLWSVVAAVNLIFFFSVVFHHCLKGTMYFCRRLLQLVFSLSTSANVSLSSADRNQSHVQEIPWTPATSCPLSPLTRPDLNQTSMAWQQWIGSSSQL